MGTFSFFGTATLRSLICGIVRRCLPGIRHDRFVVRVNGVANRLTTHRDPGTPPADRLVAAWPGIRAGRSWIAFDTAAGTVRFRNRDCTHLGALLRLAADSIDKARPANFEATIAGIEVVLSTVNSRRHATLHLHHGGTTGNYTLETGLVKDLHDWLTDTASGDDHRTAVHILSVFSGDEENGIASLLENALAGDSGTYENRVHRLDVESTDSDIVLHLGVAHCLLDSARLSRNDVARVIRGLRDTGGDRTVAERITHALS